MNERLFGFNRASALFGLRTQRGRYFIKHGRISVRLSFRPYIHANKQTSVLPSVCPVTVTAPAPLGPYPWKPIPCMDGGKFSPVFHRKLSPSGPLPCFRLNIEKNGLRPVKVSNTLCPAVHISGSKNMCSRVEGIADHNWPRPIFYELLTWWLTAALHF